MRWRVFDAVSAENAGELVEEPRWDSVLEINNWKAVIHELFKDIFILMRTIDQRIRNDIFFYEQNNVCMWFNLYLFYIFMQPGELFPHFYRCNT